MCSNRKNPAEEVETEKDEEEIEIHVESQKNMEVLLQNAIEMEEFQSLICKLCGYKCKSSFGLQRHQAGSVCKKNQKIVL
jgi:hypothetical protein